MFDEEGVFLPEHDIPRLKTFLVADDKDKEKEINDAMADAKAMIEGNPDRAARELVTYKSAGPTRA